MNNVMEFIQSIFPLLVLIFTVTNLATMGLQVSMPDVIIAFRNKVAMLLIFVWGWVLGPIIGILITILIPLDAPYVIALLLASLAPCAPFLQMMVSKAKGDLGFAGAFIPLVVIGTVFFMPLMAPLLIKGLTVDSAALAKPLILTILIPLIAGALCKHFASGMTDKIFPFIRLIAKISTLLTIIACLVLYGTDMLDTAGSYALLSMTVFMLVMGAITYFISFNMTLNQRSVMSLGMGTRNIAAVLAGALAIPNGDPRIVIMVIMWTLWSIVLAAIAANIFGKKTA